MIEARFPIFEVESALKMKIKDLAGGHTGPIIAVIFIPKYGKPMLSFCCQMQNLGLRCQ